MLWFAFLVETLCVLLPHPENNPDLNFRVGFITVFFALTTLGLAWIEKGKSNAR